jgi:hypothetical protein
MLMLLDHSLKLFQCTVDMTRVEVIDSKSYNRVFHVAWKEVYSLSCLGKPAGIPAWCLTVCVLFG